MFLGTQHCATVEEYREKMAELVETGRRHLNLKQVYCLSFLWLHEHLLHSLDHHVTFSSPPLQTRVGTLFANLFNILIEHKVTAQIVILVLSVYIRPMLALDLGSLLSWGKNLGL